MSKPVWATTTSYFKLRDRSSASNSPTRSARDRCRVRRRREVGGRLGSPEDGLLEADEVGSGLIDLVRPRLGATGEVGRLRLRVGGGHGGDELELRRRRGDRPRSVPKSRFRVITVSSPPAACVLVVPGPTVSSVGFLGDDNRPPCPPAAGLVVLAAEDHDVIVPVRLDAKDSSTDRRVPPQRVGNAPLGTRPAIT